MGRFLMVKLFSLVIRFLGHLGVKRCLELLVVVVDLEALVLAEALVILLHEIIGRELDGDVGLEVAILGLHQLLADGTNALEGLINYLAVQLLEALLQFLALVHFA